MRVTQKSLEKLAMTVSSGLSEAGWKVWLAFIENDKGQNVVTIWAAPKNRLKDKRAIESGISLREAYFSLNSFKQLRQIYRNGMARNVAGVFGMQLTMNAESPG